MFNFLNNLLRPRSETVPGFYRTHPGDVFLPGAGNAVFEPAFQLPPIQLIGAGIYAGMLPLWRGPQTVVPQAVPIAGIGGVQAGQYVSQPLSVMETTNGSE